METQVEEKKGISENGKTPEKTCRLVIVQNGISDKVIKVHPAEMETEKIWLDNTQGIERWESVKRFMYQYAKRGTAIPKPVPMCSSKLNVVDLQEYEIPLVDLEEGFYLKAPPVPEKAPSKLELPKAASDPEIEKRVSTIEKGLETLTGLVSGIAERLNKAASSVAEFEARPSHQETCPECGKGFASKPAMAMHIGRFHKKGEGK